MAGKTPNFGDNLSVLSVDLVKELVAFHAEGTLIEAGQDTLRRGMQQLEDVGRRNHLSSLRLPEPLRFVVVPVQTDLYVEAWQRSGRLRSHNWVALEEEEALRHHVMWTHDNPLKRHPVFVGNLQEIDYETPLKTVGYITTAASVSGRRCAGAWTCLYVLQPK